MIDLHPGLRVGRWTIVAAAPDAARQSMRLRSRWWCQCECGVEKPVLAQSLQLALRSSVGGSRSCGCLCVERSTRHGNAKGGQQTAEYQSWIAAKKRCSNPRNASYCDYGARGIRMCPAWDVSFELFLFDMGSKPSASHSLDRIDTNGNYEARNCRWATPMVQARNKRNVTWYAFEGQQLVLAELAARLSITRGQARNFERHGRLPAWRIPGAGYKLSAPDADVVDLNDTPNGDRAYRVGQSTLVGAS